MKNSKIILILLGSFTILSGILFVMIRTPSYNIQTSGKLYIVNKLSSNITVFDLFEGKELDEFPIQIEPHEAVTLKDQQSVALTNYGAPHITGKSISIIDTKTNTVKKTIDLDESLRPHGIVAFPNSNKVGIVTDIGNDLLVVNTETGQVEKKISTGQDLSHLLVLHPFRPLAYVSNINSGSVSVIDLESDRLIKIIPCGLGTEGIDITPDGKEIWVTNHKENSISVISTDTHIITDTLSTGEESLRLKFSNDGKICLVTNARDGTISVYDRHSKTQIKTIHIPGKRNLLERILHHTPRPVGIYIHPNGLYAFVANSNADRVEVIDMRTLSLVSSIGTAEVPDGLTLVE
jgi:YVTN family beta-propeller protein